LKQKQVEFTDSTKVSTKLGIEQSIDGLEKMLADIELAKQRFAEWQTIKTNFSELDEAKSKLEALEYAVEAINKKNVAVRAYIDFKIDALQQVYNIDERLAKLGKKIISPVIELKDKATKEIKAISSRVKSFASQKLTNLVMP
jgi:DNA repair ATPase RecN